MSQKPSKVVIFGGAFIVLVMLLGLVGGILGWGEEALPPPPEPVRSAPAKAAPAPAGPIDCVGGGLSVWSQEDKGDPRCRELWSDLALARPSAAVYVTARELWQAYHRNEVAADEQFRGRTVVVSGTITEIGKNLFDQPFVALRGRGRWDVVRCFFDSPSGLAELRRGHNVNLVGEGRGATLGDPDVVGCSVGHPGVAAAERFASLMCRCTTRNCADTVRFAFDDWSSEGRQTQEEYDAIKAATKLLTECHERLAPDPVVAAAEDLAQRLCACAEAACTEGVFGEFLSWRQEIGADFDGGDAGEAVARLLACHARLAPDE